MTEPGTNSIPGCDGFTNNTAGDTSDQRRGNPRHPRR